MQGTAVTEERGQVRGRPRWWFFSQPGACQGHGLSEKAALIGVC